MRATGIRRLTLLTCTALMLGVQVLAVPFGKPEDHTNRIPGFAPFAARLKQAVEARDADYIRSLMVPETQVGWGIEWHPMSQRERQAALKEWSSGLDDPKALFWTVMDRYVQWGIKWDDSQRVARYPSIDSQRRDVRFEAQGMDGVIAGTGVNVRAAPGRSAKVLTVLNWETVLTPMSRVARPGPWFLEQGPYYTKIRLADGRVGYVSNDFVWTYPGWEAHFKQVNGEWKLSAFTHGGC